MATTKIYLSFKDLETIGQDSISRSEAIVAEHTADGASSDGIFLRDQDLPALEETQRPVLDGEPQAVEVVNEDSFKAARVIMNDLPESRGKVAVLNLASDILPAGPWLSVWTKTQEEALCYSSTLYKTLKEEYYPWPNVGEGSVAGIFSPGVVIFKDDLDHGCVDLPLEDRRVVSVVTAAAPRHRRLNRELTEFQNSADLENLKAKIRLIYRMAARNGKQYLVLGAIGCAAYGNPPKRVAAEMRTILQEDEFKGWFRKVVFAVYDGAAKHHENWSNVPTNFKIFFDELNGATL
ncbi:hypothetical protein DL96DRAFT_184721 [Flagelloscypha sp. PMI_526]|nr:hypothetical protein DL96DRAFT_184721 [Flagelloscypha sp. PMI_526]